MTLKLSFLVVIAAFLVALSAKAQSGGTNCTPVKAKNQEEALKMETSSNKNGCWVRQKDPDGRDAGIAFISKAAPDKNYKPLPLPSAPIPGRIEQLKTGPARPDLNHVVVGTWTGKWMKFDGVMTLSLSGVDGGRLSGILQAKDYSIDKGESDSQAAAGITWTGKTIELPVIDPRFDGAVLTFKVKTEERVVDMALSFGSGQLVWPGMNFFGSEPTRFIRTSAPVLNTQKQGK